MIQARESNQTPSLLRCAASASRSRPSARSAVVGSSRFSASLVQAKPRTHSQGGGHVWAVVDRLVDAGEDDVVEPGRLQKLLNGRRVGEREWIRSRGSGGHRSLRSFEGSADHDVPLVALRGLPDHHHQAPGRAQRPPDVGERGAGIAEEHRAEPADPQVEALGRKAVDLRVGALEGDVADPLSPGELAGTLDGARGDVHAKRAACLGRARGLPGRLPGPASDVEDVVVDLDATRLVQDLVVQPQFGVVAAGAGPVFASGARPHRSPVTMAGVAPAQPVIGVHRVCPPPFPACG